MNEKTEFSTRLKAAMSKAGYEIRPVVLEREFNTRYWGRSVTLQAVRRWLIGEAIPAQDKLQVLADWLSIEPHTLRFGETTAKKLKAAEKRWDEGLGLAEREVLEAFLDLPPQQRKTIREVIFAFKKAMA